jgi:HTH-type transcriptional regulator, fmd operon transcriptional regulator
MTRCSYKHFEMSSSAGKPKKETLELPSPRQYLYGLYGAAALGRVNEKCLSSDRKFDSMKDGLLTDRQMEVLRYRKQGLTQQQIADIISTSKANVCTIEKSAMENIRRAKETLEFLYTLDATHLCTIPSGTDLFEVPAIIFSEAEKINIKVKYDTISLINRLRESRPQCCKARCMCEDVLVYITDVGELYFG